MAEPQCLYKVAIYRTLLYITADRDSTVIKVLCYKSEGRSFDPSWCHWKFSLSLNSSDRAMVLGSTQPLTEMSTRSNSWGLKWPVRKADNLPPSCAVVMKSRINLLEPSGPFQACNGTVLSLPYFTTKYKCVSCYRQEYGRKIRISKPLVLYAAMYRSYMLTIEHYLKYIHFPGRFSTN